MKRFRTLGIAGGTISAFAACAGTSAAQSTPRYPTPTPVTPPTTHGPEQEVSDVPTPISPIEDPHASTSSTHGTSGTATPAGTTGTGQSTTRARGDVDATGARYGAGATHASTTTTTAAPYDPYGNTDTTRRTYRPNRPMLIVGSSIFLGSYATTAVVGATSNLDADRNLFIPVAGPWIDLADRPCGFGDCGSREDLNNALLIGGGVTQAAGLAVAIASFFVPERDHPRRSTAAAKPTVQVAPLSLARGAGLGAVGSF